MAKEKNICCATINDKTSRHIMRKMINGYPDEICGCKANYFENNEWYCGKHAPTKIEERQRISYEKWKAKMDSKILKSEV
jgi:proteasome lid subunit RPN8/RPN11